MQKSFLIILIISAHSFFYSQGDSIHFLPTNKGLKFSLNEDGSAFFQITFLNQVWLRYNESNDSTTVFGKNAPHTFDIGLRRTRIQMFGQINDRAFVYFQFGQNNFNQASNYIGNRKIAAFFHDALCEYKASKGNQLKIGAGLTIMNGLSRYSQPSIGTAPTLDVPVFLQYSVDQIDIFDRRLAVYARGQLKKFDYRLYVANPFPISSNGSIPPAIGKNATFVNPSALVNGKSPGVSNQYGAYFLYNFFDNEQHTTPYMTGTYLGTKKILNIAIGSVYQKNALWNLQERVGMPGDTVYHDMFHLGGELFADMPVGTKGSAFNAALGFYNMNYGTGYLRYNGLMNPATGSTASTMLQSNAYGNAFPMFGTGQVVYFQFAWLLATKNEKKWMPYSNFQYSRLQALQNKNMLIADAGITWLFSGNTSKITLGIQNRPTYFLGTDNSVVSGTRKNAVILQYQIMF
jgi:hypothetical protein